MTVGLGEDIIGKFGWTNRFQIIVHEGLLVQVIGILYFVLKRTFIKRSVSVVLVLGLISIVCHG